MHAHFQYIFTYACTRTRTHTYELDYKLFIKSKKLKSNTSFTVRLPREMCWPKFQKVNSVKE